ncbi:hypothetical protein GJV85_02740 [Sulfurimonas aquatica]|uniref:Uncharacterized protein n=1 Tax=Sulfurimonas aquatica TaxID=2672570 RepID=A0A975GBV2_9BACT|nr:hypothetical protein [Sulfurimonas aquatica]QSZ41076.1 hypothetical protein GJV85_02740 [Sulfurimonas aquatica]
MYTVQMQKECECFQKSEYTNNSTFQTQQEAYKYANILVELMNEEFCGRHTFYPEVGENDTFIIKVDLNATFVSGCSTGVTCDVGCGSTDDWTLEATDKSDDESCGTGCGCA